MVKEDDDIRDGFFYDLLKKFKKNKKIYFITADQGTFKLQEFISFDNKRVINVGISEQLLISFASGLSGAGNIVYIYAISSFLIFRAFEQLKVNLVLNNPNVKIIGMGTGFCYSQDGPTHHSLEDIGVLRPYSNSISIYTASNSITSELISRKVYNNKGIDYVRLDKGNYNYDNSYKNYKHLDNLFIFKKGKFKKCIISNGILVNYIFRKYIRKNIQLVDIYKSSILTKNTIKYLSSFKEIMIIEENLANSSLGSILESYLISFSIKITKIGINDIKNFDYGSREYLINKHIFNIKNKKLIEKFVK